MAEAKEKSAEEMAAEAAAADRELAKPMQIAEAAFLLTLPSDAAHDADAVKAQLLTDIQDRGMSRFYELQCELLGWAKDASFLAKLKAANDVELKKLDAKIEDAKENFGTNEVMEAMKDKAQFFARIGDKDKAFEAYAAIPEKSLSKGQKIDIALHEIRMCFFYGDVETAKTKIDLARRLNDEGGDWDRRNRLKIYEAVYFMHVRDFAKSAELLLDSIATFTCLEMFSFKQLVFYTVVLSVFALDRVTLKRRVLESPDVLSVILEVPHLSEYLNSLYDCDYSGFFAQMVKLHPILLRDRYLSQHLTYYVREMRIKAYSQFLDAYLSVTTSSMAASFGVSEEFLDRELSRFISSGRINAKIDKIAGIIETTRPDARTAKYQSILKQGDVLLNRIQRLARVVSM